MKLPKLQGATAMASETTEFFFVAGGRIHCRQCSARSKRTKNRCQAPAIRGKTKCRFHGGLSTGARTPEGKAHSARTTHGTATRAARQQLTDELCQIQGLRVLAWLVGLGHMRQARSQLSGRAGPSRRSLILCGLVAAAFA